MSKKGNGVLCHFKDKRNLNSFFSQNGGGKLEFTSKWNRAKARQVSWLTSDMKIQHQESVFTHVINEHLFQPKEKKTIA